MLSKTLIVTALTMGTVGGSGAVLQPSEFELAAGPVRISAGGEQGLAAHLDPAFDFRASILMRGKTRLTLGR